MKILQLLLYVVVIAVVGSTVYVYQTLTVEVMPREEDPYTQLRKSSMKAPGEGETPVPDIEALLSMNPDYKGWLHIPETPISHPVVQGNDNVFYLHNSFAGAPSAYGCLFFDSQTDLKDMNWVIYGHNMGPGRQEMFSTLVRYQSPEYAEEHKYLYFTGIDSAISIFQVFAVINFDTRQISSFDYRKPNFAKESEYTSFIAKLQNESVYESPFVPVSQPLLILSTCNRRFGESNRLIICCGEIS